MTPSVPLGKVGNDGRLIGYFCSEVVLNLSHKVLFDLEIEVLGKGIGFSPTLSFYHLLMKQVLKVIFQIFQDK